MYITTVQYDSKRVSLKRRKWLIRWMKFRLYLRFPRLLFRRVKWEVGELEGLTFFIEGDRILSVSAGGEHAR